jgi:hypothetical protein
MNRWAITLLMCLLLVGRLTYAQAQPVAGIQAYAQAQPTTDYCETEVGTKDAKTEEPTTNNKKEATPKEDLAERNEI